MEAVATEALGAPTASLTRVSDSSLETLPEELLIRVLCSVEHADLTQLYRVSHTIRRAALSAKTLHFKYSTPKKTIIAFRNSVDLDESLSDDEFEAPGAPLMKRRRRLERRDDVAAVTVALFTDEGEDARPAGRDGSKMEFDESSCVYAT
ncbi:hypothetical protein QQ045_009584 [Rhodiola kirilowii]